MNSSSLRRFGGYLRTRWVSPRRIRFWLLVLVILYTLLGFFAVPWIAQNLAVKVAREDFGRDLRIESVHANPYTLTLRIDGLELDDTDDQQLLGWQRLFIDLAWSGLINRTWTFTKIHLINPTIQEERFASGETRLSRLTAKRSDQASAENDPAPLPALKVDNFHVEGGVVHITDNIEDSTGVENEPIEVSHSLQDIGLNVEDFSLKEGAHFPVRLNGQLAGGGGLSLDGTFQLLPTAALKGDVRIDNLALKKAEPYLRQTVNVRLESGRLSLNGQIRTDAQEPFAFHGSASVEALDIRDGSNDEALVGWRSLTVEPLHLSLLERQLETGPVAIDDLSGVVVIHEDRTTNFSQLMATPPVDSEAEEQKASTDRTGNESAPVGITIESVELTDGALRFADHSLPLPFSTRIHSLSGNISTLSSVSAQPAEVELEGQIAEYGLARVKGTLHAWHPTRETNVQLTFRNLQIPEYSPYTVRFAGRKIAEGTMDLDLRYTIKDKQLDGSNSLVLNDLKLGEKMESSTAMDLPLDLAIGLLQDNNGVIDLDLPVTGDIGNPEFDVGQIIRQALGDALKSVVEAPFRFLANLVGADSQDLGQVEFSGGRTDLLPPERARIATLREALNQRSALVLELAGPFNRTLDGPVLQREKAIEALKERLTEADSDVSSPSLTAEANQNIIEAMFSADYSDVDLEEVRARFSEGQSASSDENGFDALSYRNYLAEKVIAAQSVTDEEFKAIANARAAAVRDALVDPNEEARIAAKRVRLLDPKEVDLLEGERIAMEVGITAN